MASFGGFFGNLKIITQQFLSVVGGFLHSFFQQETKFFQFFFDLEDTVKRAERQLQEFRDLSFDLTKFNGRVISFKSAKKSAVELRDEVVDLFTKKLAALRDELKAFAKQFEQGQQPAVGAEADAGAVTNVTLKLNDILNKLNATAKLINDILDFTEQIADIKKKIQSLDGIFLPQTNKRKTVRARARIRVGKLHMSA